MIARIRAVLRRAQTSDEPRPGPIRVGDIEVDLAARRAIVAGAEVELSRKEFDLLSELVRTGRGRHPRELGGVSGQELVRLDEDARRPRGLAGRKLGDGDYIDTVRGVGFRFAAPAGETP